MSRRRGERWRRRAPLIGLALALACTSTPTLRIAPVADPPTGRVQPGRFVRVDLVTHDVAGAKAFYGALFGWDFEGEEDGYVTVLADGRPIAAMAPATATTTAAASTATPSPRPSAAAAPAASAARTG